MPEQSVWEGTEINIRYSMIDGGADAEGQQKMNWAVRQANVDFMGAFKDGFHETQRSKIVTASFDACCDEDYRRVYNIGRKILGLTSV